MREQLVKEQSENGQTTKEQSEGVKVQSKNERAAKNRTFKGNPFTPQADDNLLSDERPHETTPFEALENMSKGQRFLRNLALSVIIAAAAAGFGVIYSIIVHSTVYLRYIFNAGFIVAALVIAAGLAVFAVPPRLRDRHLIDHTNYADIVMRKRESKRRRSFNILYIGFGTFLLTGLTEVLVWWILTS